MLSGLQMSTWDEFAIKLSNCTRNPFILNAPTWTAEDQEAFVAKAFRDIAGNVMATIYLALTTISLTVLYYIIRPPVHETKGREVFLAWWSRGRFLVLLIFTGMVGTVVAVLCFSNEWYVNFVTPTFLLCSAYRKRWGDYIIAVCSLVGAVFVSLYLMV